MINYTEMRDKNEYLQDDECFNENDFYQVKKQVKYLCNGDQCNISFNKSSNNPENITSEIYVSCRKFRGASETRSAIIKIFSLIYNYKSSYCTRGYSGGGDCTTHFNCEKKRIGSRDHSSQIRKEINNGGSNCRVLIIL
ncbi:hypothetical protein AYI68_g7831 [Smittium mucronatum]|uniref:Uncharacterized protein n=1 Tax=Smittium mucronatum TaxID=133383 RepID=A0A1R0GML8_9FUNG|nr:hypothetical protein AYI68_g7831 [Smittium mucronatum]